MMTYKEMKDLEHTHGCVWYVSKDLELCADGIVRCNLCNVRLIRTAALLGEHQRVVACADVRGIDNDVRGYDVDASRFFVDKAKAARFILGNLNIALPPDAGLPQELVGVEEDRKRLHNMMYYAPAEMTED